MAWYYILFFSVFAVFIIKNILSWIFGDTDIDFDADGDIDFDISSMLSFKGVLHFLLGFSTYLAATARFDRTYDVIGTYQFTSLHYCTAILIGFLFMVALWYLYKLMMKLNHSNENEYDLNGCTGTISTILNNGDYLVNVRTPGGIIKKQLSKKQLSSPHKLNIGDEVTVIKDIENNEYFVQ